MSGIASSSTQFVVNQRAVLAWSLMLLCLGLGIAVLIQIQRHDHGGHRYLFAAIFLIPSLWIYLPATYRWSLDQRGISRGRHLVLWGEITRLDLRTFPKGFRSPGSIDLLLHSGNKRLLLRTYVENDARELSRRLREALPETLFSAASQRRVEEVWKRR
jgi:hypothetical protein